MSSPLDPSPSLSQYGSPNQNRRAQQSRHQLSASHPGSSSGSPTTAQGQTLEQQQQSQHPRAYSFDPAAVVSASFPHTPATATSATAPGPPGGDAASTRSSSASSVGLLPGARRSTVRGFYAPPEYGGPGRYHNGSDTARTRERDWHGAAQQHEQAQQTQQGLHQDWRDYPSLRDIRHHAAAAAQHTLDPFTDPSRTSVAHPFGTGMDTNSDAHNTAGARAQEARQSRVPGAELYNSLRWSRDRPRVDPKRRMQLFASYLPDWIITILLTGLFSIINKVHGFRREFSLTDTSLQHTHALEERVPVWLLVVTSVIAPIIVIAGVSLGLARSVWDCHNGILGLILSLALTTTVTTIVKVCVGRPRPDVIDRCQPRPGSMDAPVFGLVTDSICANDVDSSLVTDGFRSFPSGHSSMAFAGLGFLTLYLAAKFHLFDRRGHAIVAWVTLLPFTGAVLIAVSRTMDYRHHATDVIAGGILGFVLMWLVYRLYYPPLSHPQCHKPYSPRIPRSAVHHHQDVETASEPRTSYTPAPAHSPTGGPTSQGRVLTAAQHVVQHYNNGASGSGANANLNLNADGDPTRASASSDQREIVEMESETLPRPEGPKEEDIGPLGPAALPSWSNEHARH